MRIRGYLICTIDKELEIKTADYIENENPGFFGQHRHLIESFWSFDSEDLEKTYQILRSLARLKVDEQQVKNFLRYMNTDPQSFVKEYRAYKEKLNESNA